jgi:hypothetical protein
MPRPLPEDLFTDQIGRETKRDLQLFREGEVGREEIHKRVRERVDIAMNTIAASQGADPNAQKLEKKE